MWPEKTLHFLHRRKGFFEYYGLQPAVFSYVTGCKDTLIKSASTKALKRPAEDIMSGMGFGKKRIEITNLYKYLNLLKLLEMKHNTFVL